jgi:hypothetical protein
MLLTPCNPRAPRRSLFFCCNEKQKWESENRVESNQIEPMNVKQGVSRFTVSYAGRFTHVGLDVGASESRKGEEEECCQ